MIKKTSSSGHPYYLTDDGLYVFKPAAYPFLADQEHAANTLGRLWGYDTPASHTATVEGMFGQVQVRVPAVGDLEYGARLGFYDAAPIPWGELSTVELCDIAREHVLDWMLANDDGRPSNYLRTPDGRIVGVDKGRTFAPGWETWPGLSGDWHADTRSWQVSTGLYDAIRSGEISAASAEAARAAAMERAAEIQASDDDAIRTIMAEGFARRPGGDAGKIIDGMLARKATVLADFRRMWAAVYNSAGLTG